MSKIIDLYRKRAELKRELQKVEQELCVHKETYKDSYWTYSGDRCKSCGKMVKYDWKKE